MPRKSLTKSTSTHVGKSDTPKAQSSKTKTKPKSKSKSKMTKTTATTVQKTDPDTSTSTQSKSTATTKTPKKRGRKPKASSSAGEKEKKVPKKRGRKPKPKAQQAPKIPKKRGRKPKQKNLGSVVHPVHQIQSDNIIVHLPINSEKVLQTSKETELLTYNPTVSEPQPYQTDSIGNKMLDNVAFIENLKNASESRTINAIGANNTKYSAYPFDRKEEEDIVDLLEDSPTPDVSENEEEESESVQTTGAVETLESIDMSPQARHNRVHDTSVSHNKNWFYDRQEKQEDSSYNDIIKNMKKHRRKELETFKMRHNSNTVEPIMKQYMESNRTCSWPLSTSIYCWWCCHPFDGAPAPLPYKYEKKAFHVLGNFCSPECAAAYNFDKFEGEEVWERYALLNFLYKKIYNERNVKIKLACPRETLKIFGGNLTIKEFRSQHSNYERDFKIIYPPLISVIPQQEYSFIQKGYSSDFANQFQTTGERGPDTASQDKHSGKNMELRLKRSKPFISAKNTLEKCMNLTLQQ